ncbi:MAG: hypothetical protein L6R39_000279 [Caloplaca ligustica]|nr:MAG: hypothetical protein L6R39_000279 [Caloplaca ligustica]
MAENGKAGLYWDGRRKFRGNRQRLFDQARQAVHPDKGTRYPCSLQNILSYRRRPEKSYKNPWSNEVATNKLVNFLNEPIKEGSKERAALYRLADGMQLEKWGPDLIIKAFDDLDLVFFRGVLATRTQISWMTTREIRAKGLTSSVFGFTEPLGHGRAHIVLNSTIIFLEDPNPFAQMWSTMLHEMVHAYFDALCDSTYPSRTDAAMGKEWLDGHGHCFRKVITAVDKRYHKYFHMYASTLAEGLNLDRCGVRGRWQ